MHHVSMCYLNEPLSEKDLKGERSHPTPGFPGPPSNQYSHGGPSGARMRWFSAFAIYQSCAFDALKASNFYWIPKVITFCSFIDIYLDRLRQLARLTSLRERWQAPCSGRKLFSISIGSKKFQLKKKIMNLWSHLVHKAAKLKVYITGEGTYA